MKDQLHALKLLQKTADPSVSFLDGSTDMEALSHHANEGKEPVSKALESEMQFLIELKSHILFHYIVVFSNVKPVQLTKDSAAWSQNQPFPLT